MSTEFSFNNNGGLAFVRWGRGNDLGYEFGTISNFEYVLAELESGAELESEQDLLESDPTTAAKLKEAVVDGRVTFGEFPVTLLLRSGDLYRFTVEE
ncbi:hypothetical protein [Nocardia brasiliensis]|uniref:hypothetical protein n=1 Tax=Nocardia brasiliensis TaxID=37326 RepID=UPI00366B7A91